MRIIRTILIIIIRIRRRRRNRRRRRRRRNKRRRRSNENALSRYNVMMIILRNVIISVLLEKIVDM